MTKFMFFLLSMFCLGLAIDWPPLTQTDCDFTRDDAFACFKNLADKDNNDAISRAEIDAMRATVPWYYKPALLALSTNRIMHDCDYDKNGVITARDWKLAGPPDGHCLAKREHVCIAKWVCDRAEQRENEK